MERARVGNSWETHGRRFRVAELIYRLPLSSAFVKKNSAAARYSAPLTGKRNAIDLVLLLRPRKITSCKERAEPVAEIAFRGMVFSFGRGGRNVSVGWRNCWGFGNGKSFRLRTVDLYVDIEAVLHSS